MRLVIYFSIIPCGLKVISQHFFNTTIFLTASLVSPLGIALEIFFFFYHCPPNIGQGNRFMASNKGF